MRYSKFAQGPQRQVLAGSGGVHGHLRIWEAGQRANIYSKLKTLSQNKKREEKNETLSQCLSTVHKQWVKEKGRTAEVSGALATA